MTKVFLGFNFTFYNVSYSTVYISSNGNIQFATENSQFSPSAFGANNAAVAPFIAFFYLDLFPAAAPASQTYATLGTAPNRQFILRFSQVPLQNYVSDETLSCDVLLYEGSNRIEFRYYSVPSESSTGNLVVIGIQNAVIGSTYDSVALINNKQLLLNLLLPLAASGWTFTPLRAFTNPAPFVGDRPAKPVTSGSTVYTATLAVAPLPPVTFTPTASLPLEDDGVEAVFLGFNFTFYNVAYSTVYVSSNGNIQFATDSTVFSPAAFGSGNAAVAPFIAFFYTDLDPYTAPFFPHLRHHRHCAQPPVHPALLPGAAGRQRLRRELRRPVADLRCAAVRDEQSDRAPLLSDAGLQWFVPGGHRHPELRPQQHVRLGLYHQQRAGHTHPGA